MYKIDDKPYRVTSLAGAAYALPAAPVLMLMSSNHVLPGIYATHHGLALSAISMVMLIAGLFDVVTDPSIGYFSDRYHARTGSRRPFVLIGAILLIPCAWFLLSPGEGISITYFLVWYLLFYLAMTLFRIPHLTWGGEISPISEEKCKVYTYRNYAAYAGMIIFALIPLLPFYPGTRVTPETMRMLVIVAGALLMPALCFMWCHAPTGVHRLNQIRAPENPFRAIATLAYNPPALWFFGVTILHAFAGAFYIGLYFMVMESYLHLGQYYAHFTLFHLVAATVAIKPAMRVILNLGNIRALMLVYALGIVSSMILLVVLMSDTNSLVLLVLFNAVYAFSCAMGNVAVFSLLSDISDYGTLKSGVDRSATYFSVSSLAGKTCTALGIAASIATAGWFGFDPKAELQGSQVVWGLVLCMAIIPIALNLIAVCCVSKTAITTWRHNVIKRRLDAKAVHASKTNTISPAFFDSPSVP